jgi:cysteine desulfurase
MSECFDDDALIYFDHNATSPVHPVAQAAWLQAAQEFSANPSSPHRLGARADAALANAREKLARLLGCSSFDIVWTSGASESSNMVFHHAARTLPPGSEVWVSAIEHPCVLEPARQYFGSRIRLVPATRKGVVDLGWFKRKLKTSRPGLVALMAANNESGILQPWQETTSLCQEAGVAILCDAVQWIGKLPAAGIGCCDFVVGSAHKFGGPKGVGFIKSPKGQSLEPLIYGGPQQEGRRAGTENVAGILAMVAMIEEREKALSSGHHQLRESCRTTFEHDLLEGLPGSAIIGAKQPRLWNTVFALMPEADCRRRWVVTLDKIGFAVSTGSACSSGKEAPSHVLAAMGYSAAEAGRVLRFSSSWETTPEDWSQLVRALREAAFILKSK